MDNTFEELSQEITDLWEEHMNAPFPEDYVGKDINGIDFVLLDTSIAGCITSFIESGNLNTYQTAILGLSYRNANFILSIIKEDGIEYLGRLERLAELVLKAVAIRNHAEHLKN